MAVTFGGLTVEVGGEVDPAFVAAVRDMVDELYRAEHAALETEKGIEALAEAAGVSVEDYKRATAAMEQAEKASAKAAQQNTKQTTTWTELNSALEVAQKGYSAVVGVVGQVVSAVDRVAALASEQSRLDAASVRLGLDLNAAADAAGRFTDETEVMTAAARFAEAGLRLTQGEADGLSRRAAQLAQNLGIDTTEAFEQLYNAIESGSERALRPFGTEMAALAGDSHTAQERLSAFVAQAQRMPPATDDAATSMARLRDSIEDAARSASSGLTVGFIAVTREMARYREEHERLAGVVSRAEEDFRGFGETLGNMLGEVVAFGRAIADLWTAMHRFDEAGTRARAGLAAFSQRWGDALLSVMGFTPAVTAATTAVDAQGASMQRAATQAADYARELQRLSGVVGGSLAASRGPTYRTAAGGYGPVDEGDLSEAERDALNRRLNAEEQSRFAKAEAAARSARERRSGGGRRGTDTETDRLRQQGTAFALAAMRQREEDAARDRAFLAVEADALIDRAAREATAKGSGTANRQHEVEAELQRNAERRRDLRQREMEDAQKLSGTLTEAFGAMATAAQAAFKAVAAGQIGVAEGFRQMAESIIDTLAQMALRKGLFELAEGIAAAIYNPPAAAAHFTASATYLGLAALGGLAGAGLSAAKSSPASAPSSAAPVSTPGGGSSSGGGGGNTTVVNNYYSPVIGNREATDSDVGDQLSRYQPRTRRARS